MEIGDVYDVWAETDTGTPLIDSRAYTCHVVDPDHSFLFGAEYNGDGEIVKHQFEKDGQRIQLEDI